MNELSIEFINNRSPYRVEAGERNSFLLKTDFDVLYRIGFSDNNIIWQKGAYEFGIYNINGKASPNDRKLRDTIVSTIIAEEQTNYAAIIVQRNNPYLEQIVREFDAFVDFFTEKPL